MKLVYIHIPKTAGSSVNKFLEGSIRRGIWLANGELEQQPEALWDLDYISGHFTRAELFSWISSKNIYWGNARLMTVVRHPMEQLLSNLSFPYELSARGERVSEPWMVDILKINHQSSSDLYNFLIKYPWLLNIQWQYIVTGASLNEALDYFDNISIFPSVTSPIVYSANVLAAPVPQTEIHENQSRGKYINGSVFSDRILRKLILSHHSLDIELYLKVVFEKLRLCELGAVVNHIPATPKAFLDEWLSPLI